MNGIRRWFFVVWFATGSVPAAADVPDPPASIDDLSRALEKKPSKDAAKKPTSQLSALEQAVPGAPASMRAKKPAPKAAPAGPAAPLPAAPSPGTAQAAQAEAMLQVIFQPRPLKGRRIVALRVLLNGKLVAQEKSDSALHGQGEPAILHSAPLAMGSHKLRVVLLLKEDVALDLGSKRRGSKTGQTIQAEYTFLAAHHKVLVISASLVPADKQGEDWVISFQESHLPLNVATKRRVTPHRTAAPRAPAARPR